MVGIAAAPILFIQGLLGMHAEAPEPNLGAALPQAVGIFETSLQSPLSQSATTLTLYSNSIRGGGTLSGYNCFTIDEGSAQAEVVCGTVSGLSVTAVTRGISYEDGMTSVAGNQFSHRRGANIKITDFPIIQIIKAQNAGETTFDSPIRYGSSVSTSSLSANGQNLASVAYANGLSFGAVAAASEAAAGFVELATGPEAASTTLSGSAARLALSAAISTSTRPVSGNYVPVTLSTGALSSTWFAGISVNGSSTLATSTYIGTTASTTNLLINMGKNIVVLTNTATSTWSVPAGVSKIKATVVGGGGVGGSCTAGGSPTALDYGAGGPGGGWAYRIIDVSATTSVSYRVGSSTQTTFFGSFLSATGGGTSGEGLSAASGAGVGGDVNGAGTLGDTGYGYGGYGGASLFGGGALGRTGSNVGITATVPGSGGGGGACTGSDTRAGGDGANGLIILEY